MTYETDERLKTYLDTNQLKREQLCLAVLRTDKRYSNVRPRHPRGGRDGSRDMEADYMASKKAFAAVGFLNQASDSKDTRKKAQSKFMNDIDNALAAAPEIQAFAFFTNVNLTVGQKKALNEYAAKKGILHSDIYDRERIGIVLDSPDGLAIRYQILDIPLSDAEQAAFFAKWGDDIQSMIADGFGQVNKALNRMQFLYEAEAAIDQFILVAELDREYDGSEIGHFRLFCTLTLKEMVNGLFCINFGTTDNPNRPNAKSEADLDVAQSGIANGMSGIHFDYYARQNEKSVDLVLPKSDGKVTKKRRAHLISTFSSVGISRTRFLRTTFGYDSLIRDKPVPKLRDLDGSMFGLFVNDALVPKLKAIHIYCNQYKLAEFEADKFRTNRHDKLADSSYMVFSKKEIADGWIRIMSNGAFRLEFTEVTPVRVFRAGELVNSLTASRQNKP